MPLSPVHERNLIAARRASSMMRCIFSASRQLASFLAQIIESWDRARITDCAPPVHPGIASVRTLSRSAVSAPGLSPIMCRVRFFKKAVFSLLGTVSPMGKSQGFSVSLPSRYTLMTRPAHQLNQRLVRIPPLQNRYQWLARAIIRRNP